MKCIEIREYGAPEVLVPAEQPVDHGRFADAGRTDESDRLTEPQVFFKGSPSFVHQARRHENLCPAGDAFRFRPFLVTIAA